ncbi:MAG: trehalose-phosphatase [candidate division Zixibacteria bacterium RBG_16_50_21]|nr:MAG: trehalose-phosphatase [candidate division Zixibacteria bacterium RBG_16_50_21]
MKYLLSQRNWTGVVKKITKARQVLLFLDYDGTLTPIKPHPSLAKLSFRTKSILRELSHFPGISICIISGRPLEEIRRVVGLTGITYVGNHGIEIGMGRRRVSIPRASQTRRSLSYLYDRLGPLGRNFPGFWVENKGFTASLHYRQVPGQEVKELLQEIESVLTPLSGKFVVTAGKKVWEIRPKINRDKAWAVKFLSRQSKSVSRLLIYLGDDFTDHKALFKVQHNGGIAIKVGRGSSDINGVYHLKSPREVLSFLTKLAGLIRLGSNRPSPENS